MDVNPVASAVEVADLKGSAFLQTQSAGVEGGEASPIAQRSDLRENRSDFFPAEDDGPLFFSGRAHPLGRGQ